MKDSNLFSIVIPTLNEGDMLRLTVSSILEQTTYSNYEIVIVDDGSTDGSCERYKNTHSTVRIVQGSGLGVAKARNLGAKHANGKFIVFLDAHCRVSPNWLYRFVTALTARDVGIVGPCFTRLWEPEPRGAGMTWLDPSLDLCWFEPADSDTPYEIPFTPGGCQAFRLNTFNALGGYDQGFGRWGSEDIEICLRSWLMGYRILVDQKITIAHDFRETRNFEVNNHDVTYNFLRLIHKHFSVKRIRRVLKRIEGVPGLQRAMDDLYNSDIFEIRSTLEAQRMRNDDWFCETFTPCLA